MRGEQRKSERARRWPRAPVLWLVVGLAACGGGGGSGGSGNPGAAPEAGLTLTPLGPGETAVDDPAAYASAGAAALPGAVEAAAVTRHSLTVGGASIAYTARAGHLITREPASGTAQASVFYVAYTADGADPATRPVTFFYNGGPGSASVWLHLGSFGPVRLATGVPATATPSPFPLVDNAESLLDTTDLVYVDAVGTGLSEALAPYSNRSFWGVDADAGVFRDFIVRWLAVNGRTASPRFLYGESYGGPRTAVLARLLQAAGVMLDGLVLQSPALDYNSNCGVIGAGSCQANLPTYAAAGAWYGLATSATADLDRYMGTLRSFTDSRYAPAVTAWLQGSAPPADLPPLLAGYTGIGTATWQRSFNLDPGTFQTTLLLGALTGRYDARISAPPGSPLALEGDPSNTYLTESFATTIAAYLRNTLRYTNASTYVLLGNAITEWNFSHAGHALPDTVPDLAAALAQNPALRVLAVNGYHDLATPFRVTENDLARLAAGPRVMVRNYPGGHMSYLDDGTRPRQKADLVAFYRGVLQARTAPVAPAMALAVRANPVPDEAGEPPAARQSPTPEPALQQPMRDPWAPPAQVQAARAERGG